MSIRQETANMIREMRNAGEKDGLRRPSFNQHFGCENGQDQEMLIVRSEEVTVADFKRFLDRLPDDAFLELNQYTDYDGYSDGIAATAIYPVKYDDVAYYCCIQATYAYFYIDRGKVEVIIDGNSVFVDRYKLNSIL